MVETRSTSSPSLPWGQLRAGETFVEDAFEARIFGLDERQGIVDAFADFGLLGGGAHGFPTGGLGHPEDVGFGVVVAVFQLGSDVFRAGLAVEVFVARVDQAQSQASVMGFEAVGDVFDEDQAKHQVLVFGRVHVGA